MKITLSTTFLLSTAAMMVITWFQATALDLHENSYLIGFTTCETLHIFYTNSCGKLQL